MKFPNPKVFTAAAIMISASAGQALAENGTAANTVNSGAPAQQAPAATMPAHPQQYRGHRPYRGDYNRGWSRPFGNDGPTFRGPWNKGSGFGFGNGPGGWGSGPSWGPGPRNYGGPDYRPRGGYYDRQYGPRPGYDRGQRFRGPDWNDSGMSFGW